MKSLIPSVLQLCVVRFLHRRFCTIRRRKKERCQLKDVDSTQRDNNAYKGPSTAESGLRLEGLFRERAFHPPFLKGHNEAVSQRVSQSGGRARLWRCWTGTVFSGGRSASDT